MRFLKIQIMKLENSIYQEPNTMDVVCGNCGTYDHGIFCSNCGCHLKNRRISLPNLISSLVDYFSNFEERYIKTFASINTSPIGFIDQYLKGFTGKYYIPFKYFLLNLGVYFFVYSFFKINLIAENSFDMEAELLLQKRSDVIFDGLINNYGSFFSLMIIPLYVYATKLFFYKSAYNLAERATAITFLLGHLMIFQAVLHLIAAMCHPFYFIQKVIVLAAEFCIFFMLSLKLFRAPLFHAIWKSILIFCFVFMGMKYILAFTQVLLQLYFGEQLINL
jgi:hypothetical protein